LFDLKLPSRAYAFIVSGFFGTAKPFPDTKQMPVQEKPYLSG